MRAPLFTAGRSPEGSASVLVCALMGVGAIFILVICAWIVAAHSQFRVSTAADLAALTAADVVAGRHSGQPCAQAANLVRLHEVHLEVCTVEGGAEGAVRVTASLPMGGFWKFIGGKAVAHARAGYSWSL